MAKFKDVVSFSEHQKLGKNCDANSSLPIQERMWIRVCVGDRGSNNVEMV